ncbi:MAG: DUF2099 family protein [Nanoarchaeota archaeon]|nr:DUF2099 family protein [Nanoarchaeota archaeon]
MNIKGIIDKAVEELGPDIHITRHCGSFVAVKDGKAVKAYGEPLCYCPIATHLYGIEKSDSPIPRDVVVQTVQSKIDKFGMFTDNRELWVEDTAIQFGASEMVMFGLKYGAIDYFVTVCEGAGTVITDNPYVAQGIGARMNGIFYTTPIRGIVDKLLGYGAVVPFEDARIDQRAGVEMALETAIERGNEEPNIAVTVNGYSAEDLGQIEVFKHIEGLNLTKLVVCTTGISKDDASFIKEYADMAWGCASREVIEDVSDKAMVQLGQLVPVYVLTQTGLDLLFSYSPDGSLKSMIEEGKKYVINFSTMGDASKSVNLGGKECHLREVESLPLRSRNEPRPLSPSR